MRIIISPAKKMVENVDVLPASGLPTLLDKTRILQKWMQGLSYVEQKALWSCSDAIARESSRQLSEMDLERGLTPALLSYDGIQYKYMAPSVFDEESLVYVQSHLRILSGFYGVLKPMDGVVPYRLEMQAKASVAGKANLYEFWGNDIYREVMDESHILINLASKEYSKAVEKHLTQNDTFITIVFSELENGKLVQKGVYAKMARGEMVRYLASINAEAPEQALQFKWSGYSFDEGASTDHRYVFVRK